MLCICNYLYSLLLNVLCYCINIYVWCCYANVKSIRIVTKNNKKHIFLKNITTYAYNQHIDYVHIIYHNYKTIIFSNNIHIDWSEYKKYIETSASKDSKIFHDDSDDDPDDDPDDAHNTTDNVVDDISGDVYMIRNCLLSIRSNIKCVVTNIHIDIDNHLSAHIYTIVIETNSQGYTCTISQMNCIYDTQSIGSLYNVTITYLISKKEIIIDIRRLTLKLLCYEINIQECIDHIMTYVTVDAEQSNYNIRLYIHTVHINMYNKNSLQMYMNTITYHSRSSMVSIQNIQIKSFKKNIVKITNIHYTCVPNAIIDIEDIYVHVYKTTSYKLKLCLDSIISKKKPKLPKSQHQYISNTLANGPLSDLIQEAYIRTDVISTNIYRPTHQQYNNDNIESKLLQQINIHKLYINVKCTPDVQIICKSIQYKHYTNQTYNIFVHSLHMKDMYDVTYIQTKYNHSNYINILFKHNFLNVHITPLYITIHEDIYKGVIEILEENINDLKKLLYYDYIKHNYKEYFIDHLFLHSIMVDVTYRPKNKSLYKNVFSSKSAYSIFNIINYKNVHLYTKEIDIYYPLHTSYLIKKIMKIWLKDVYTHQLKNIIKGVKYTKKIPKTFDISAKIINNIKILLHSGIQYLEY